MKISLKSVFVVVLGLGLTGLVGLGILAAFAPPIICTKQMRVQADIQGIRTMLLRYSGTNGHYPKTDQGLNVLVPRLMEELPRDAWGSPYVYRCPGRANPNSYDLFSAGPDCQADTADDEWGK